MKPEQNNQQSNWLAETEEVVNAEAAQINGGSSFERCSYQQQLRK